MVIADSIWPEIHAEREMPDLHFWLMTNVRAQYLLWRVGHLWDSTVWIRLIIVSERRQLILLFF